MMIFSKGCSLKNQRILGLFLIYFASFFQVEASQGEKESIDSDFQSSIISNIAKLENLEEKTKFFDDSLKKKVGPFDSLASMPDQLDFRFFSLANLKSEEGDLDFKPSFYSSFLLGIKKGNFNLNLQIPTFGGDQPSPFNEKLFQRVNLTYLMESFQLKFNRVLREPLDEISLFTNGSFTIFDVNVKGTMLSLGSIQSGIANGENNKVFLRLGADSRSKNEEGKEAIFDLRYLQSNKNRRCASIVVKATFESKIFDHILFGFGYIHDLKKSKRDLNGLITFNSDLKFSAIPLSASLRVMVCEDDFKRISFKVTDDKILTEDMEVESINVLKLSSKLWNLHPYVEISKLSKSGLTPGVIWRGNKGRAKIFVEGLSSLSSEFLSSHWLDSSLKFSIRFPNEVEKNILASLKSIGLKTFSLELSKFYSGSSINVKLEKDNARKKDKLWKEFMTSISYTDYNFGGINEIFGEHSKASISFHFPVAFWESWEGVRAKLSLEGKGFGEENLDLKVNVVGDPFKKDLLFSFDLKFLSNQGYTAKLSPAVRWYSLENKIKMAPSISVELEI